MELEQLKEMWNSADKQQTDSSAEELQALLRKKSQSPIAKMKRNLLIELVVVLVLYTLIIVYYFLNYSGGMLALPVLLFVIGLVYVFYYIGKNKLLKKMECNSCEVKANLSMQVKTLEKYVRFYLVAGTAIFPITMVVASFIILFYSPQSQQYPSALQSKQFIVMFVGILIAATALFTIPVYYINKWYVRKLYGQHIERLKSIVDEMDEEV
jgi:membrane protein insertase Oxa1/YidC/SpoIIIJ